MSRTTCGRWRRSARYWIHDALLNDKGASLWQNLLGLVPAQSGPASFLVPGTSVEL